MGQTADSVDSAGAIFAAYGAQLVDAKGNITVNSDATRQALEYCKKLVQFLPPDVFAWDDASNNKWLIAGKGALIMNPPSAWAVAKRDNPKVAEQLWTFPSPKGPKGRFQPGLPFFWGIWKFSKNKAAAKSLLTYLSQRTPVEQLVHASGGFDIPCVRRACATSRSGPRWARRRAPCTTIRRAAIRSCRSPALPRPPRSPRRCTRRRRITKMIAKFTQGGESMDKVIAWAASELEGFMRA